METSKILFNEKVKKVKLEGYYYLDGELLTFEENPWHNKTFENVAVYITNGIHNICGCEVEIDTINIEGQKEISCSLVEMGYENGELVIGICQDWG